MIDPLFVAEATICSPFWHGKTTRFHHVGCPPGVTAGQPPGPGQDGQVFTPKRRR